VYEALAAESNDLALTKEAKVEKWLTMVVCSAALAACANVNGRFDAGQRALAAGSWQQCISELERFEEDADCASDARCKQVRVDVAECRLRRGDPTNAFFELEWEAATPGSLQGRIERLKKEAQDAIASRQARATGEGTLSVRFTNQVRDRLALDRVRFLLDLQPLPTDERPYAAGAAVLAVPPTVLAAGKHELEVEAVYTGRYHDGLYSYLAAYKFETHSSQELALASGTSTEVAVRVEDDESAGPIIDALHVHFEPPVSVAAGVPSH
jgi:hypothetical protein